MRSIPRYLLQVTAVLLFGTSVASAQADSARPDSPPRRMDSIGTSSEARMTKSPLAATLYGIIPGGGQVYNEQYLRAGLFAGACGVFLGRAIYYHTLFIRKADEVSALPEGSPRLTSLKTQREIYRDTRDLNFAIYLGVHILSLVDAYVGAYLYDFDVDDDISSRVTVDPLGQQVTLTLRW